MDKTSLQPAFFMRNALAVAKDLLGMHLVYGDVVLRIVETEAYREHDTACHAHKGQTARNAPMFGPPGHAYVYLCYGIHHLFNVVVEPEGTPAAVLIRAAKVVSGEDIVRLRRSGKLDLIGPGKVGQALGVTVADSGRDLFGSLRIVSGKPPKRIQQCKRVGIDYADIKDRDALWRFVAIDDR